VRQITITQPPLENKLYNKTINTCCAAKLGKENLPQKFTPLINKKNAPVLNIKYL
jgi:hypothetical protein